MKTLDRKLLRDLWHMKSQAFSIALVVAAGIGAFIALLSTYDSLQWSRQSYYEEARFAQVFANIKSAPRAVEQQIAELPGVAALETSVVQDVTLDIENVAEPVIGRMIGLSNGSQPGLNHLTLRQGRFPERGKRNEALVSEGFAKAHGLRPGDTVAALLNGKREPLEIVGIVLSPEYIFASRGGDLPDDKGFGVFWMEHERLASAFDMEGAFNHAALSLSPGASEAAVIDALDRLLEPYGSLNAHGRKEQSSHRILDQEINQQKTMATIFPTIFLGVAVFLLNVVLTRQVATQRDQIAALKALGYADFTIAVHYLKLVLVIVLCGILLGVAVGAWMGYAMTDLYTTFFHFPRLIYRIQPWIMLVASGISLAAAMGAAYGAVRRVVSMPPAEAMRPPAPARYRRMLLEKLGLAHLLSPQARMVVRTLERRPLRTLLTSFGIASAVAIIVSGTFWGDAMDYLMEVQFNAAERADVTVTFTTPVSRTALYEIARLPGVLRSEEMRSVPVRLRAGHHTYRTAVSGYPPDADLRQLLDTQLRPVFMPGEGILLSRRLAQRLGVKPGDRLILESLEATRAKRETVVSALVNDMIGLSAYMDIAALNRLMGEGESISAVAVKLDPSQASAFYARIKQMPQVATVAIKDEMLRSFRETNRKFLLFFTAIVTAFAAAIAVGVVYNSARISLAERAWELASLRVLGFTRHEVSTLLLGELAFEIALAIPLGLWLGKLLSQLIIMLMPMETIDIPLIITPATYAYSALAILISGVVSALIVRHRVDHLDLVAVLKTRE
ncbi:MAG: ABC transporter permease [Thiobacillus sp.]|jgi:putative ABC transport system permease protein|nr:ABC transporter permease [Sulfurimicrobium sp.]MDP2198077.1 ABC transporter permease [Sulfurimicrobium sp.]MDP3685970.1 ABC transporter permease [Sulfurimicrobium sp.]MDZ7593751.1 ABC transporter permease [Thiobacillus sp.]